jgi:soluble lytic murein transglycosylase-like protein
LNATHCAATSYTNVGVLRHPAFLAFFALCTWVGPASAQDVDSTRLLPPVAPRPDAQAPFGWEFWSRLREEAHRFREELTPFRFARRYRISPELARMIEEEATAHGIDPELAFRLVRVESRFHPRARSRAGALGLMQLMPGTARGLDRSVRTEERILDPRTNLRLGLRYLRSLIRRYDGDLRLALVAYNRGENAVDRALRRGRDPENGYSGAVLGRGSDRYRGTGLIEK